MPTFHANEHKLCICRDTTTTAVNFMLSSTCDRGEIFNDIVLHRTCHVPGTTFRDEHDKVHLVLSKLADESTRQTAYGA